MIDHQLPLELGGLNSIANLRVQTRADAATKDREEYWLHASVCDGAMTLANARAKVLRDWAAREPVHR